MTKHRDRTANPRAHLGHGEVPSVSLLQVLGWVTKRAVVRGEGHTYEVADSGVDIDTQVYDLEACGLVALGPDGTVTPTQRGQRLWAERHASERPRESWRSVQFVAAIDAAAR